MGESRKLLEVRNLKKYFPIERGFLRRVVGAVRAVDDVTFVVRPGETVAVVGESGCGKTTLGRCLLGVIRATSGDVVLFDEQGQALSLTGLSEKDLRPHRSRLQMMFQDPYSSLDPRMTVADIIGEPLRAIPTLARRDREELIKRMVVSVGLEVKHLHRYPHAFSGGQRQRIGIARALVTNPSLVVCDEPVSALDVSVQAQIINLLKDLQDQHDLAYLLITHDLSVARYISSRVIIMYVGRIVETGSTQDIFSAPRHPYTEALLSAVPRITPGRKGTRLILGGEVPNPASPPSGCHFHPRCRYARRGVQQRDAGMETGRDGIRGLSFRRGAVPEGRRAVAAACPGACARSPGGSGQAQCAKERPMSSENLSTQMVLDPTERALSSSARASSSAGS